MGGSDCCCSLFYYFVCGAFGGADRGTDKAGLAEVSPNTFAHLSILEAVGPARSRDCLLPPDYFQYDKQALFTTQKYRWVQ